MPRVGWALMLGAVLGTVGCRGSLGGSASPDCAGEGNSTRYVDHLLGTDDVAHGASSGGCAFRTLTYALGHATNGISLSQPDTYQGGVQGETLPFLLTGTQSLVCNGAMLENAVDQGTYEGVVQFSGTQNGVTNCVFEGLGWGGYLLNVNSSAAAPTTPHVVADTIFSDGGNVAISVGAGFDNLSILSNDFQLNNVSIYPTGSHAHLRIAENIFSGGGAGNDVVCDDAQPGITGDSNTRGGGAITCGVCGGCPFGP